MTRFANIYSKKFKIEPEKLKKKFWGDNYFNPDTKSWTNVETTENGKSI